MNEGRAQCAFILHFFLSTIFCCPRFFAPLLVYGVLSFCEEKRIQEGISLPLVSNRSCHSAHPQSGSIFLLVYQKLLEAKISTVGGAFPAI